MSYQQRFGRLALDGDLHPFRGRAHAGVVIAGILHNLINHGVVVIGIMMKQHSSLAPLCITILTASRQWL